jgi:SAM-dependent methyltransferase
MGRTFSGEGPGSQTPDGCSVLLYRDLPYMGELEEVIEVFQPGISVLELGCGTGRLCARLVQLGCTVAGVDESAEMLAYIPEGIQAVQSKIEDLDLQEKYDSVLLASHLINHPDGAVREAFVRCAARHLKQTGRLVAKRHSAAWLESAETGPAGTAGGSSVHIEAVSRRAGLVSMTLRYELGGQTWRHSFSAKPLSEAEVEELLLQHALQHVQWRGDQRLWAVATAGDA